MIITSKSLRVNNSPFEFFYPTKCIFYGPLRVDCNFESPNGKMSQNFSNHYF